MLITHKFDMAVDRRGPAPIVDAVQGESNTRVVQISLYTTPEHNKKEPWAIPDGVSPMIRFRKKDGTGGIYDVLPDGSDAVTLAGNVITAVLAPQMLTVPGTVLAQVELTAGAKSMATFTFHVEVQPDPSVGAMESKDYYNLRKYVYEEIKKFFDDDTPTTAMTVTFSGNANSGYKADKTFSEVSTALSVGLAVIGVLKSAALNIVLDNVLMESEHGYCSFNGQVRRYAGGEAIPIESWTAILHSGDTVEVFSEYIVTGETIGNYLFGYAKKDELPKLYEVTITDNGDGTYTSDHYYADIKAAYESGRIPIAVMGTSRYQLTTLPKFASQGVLFGKQDGQIYTNIKITGTKVTVSTTTFVTPDDIPDFPNTDPFYLLISTVSDEDGYFSILGWMDGSTPTLETGLTACYNAYMQGRAVFARFEGGGEKPVELPIPCTYCDEQMAIFTWNMYGNTIQLFATEGIAELTSFDIGNCIVSVTGNDADGYTTDKSYDELMTAYEFGQTLACEYEGVRLPFVTINEDMFQFSISMGGCMTMMVLVGDGFASMATLEGTITINNVMWRGEEPMDFTDTINAMIDAKLAEIPNASGVSF